MTASDPRVGEIQARLHAATPWPWGNADDTYRSIPVHRIGSEVTGSDVAQVMLMGKQSAPDAEFIAAAPADVAYLLAELRDRDEKLARVELACDAMDAGVAMRAGDPRTKSHAATAIRAVIREPRAAVAAAGRK